MYMHIYLCKYTCAYISAKQSADEKWQADASEYAAGCQVLVASQLFE